MHFDGHERVRYRESFQTKKCGQFLDASRGWPERGAHAIVQCFNELLQLQHAYLGAGTTRTTARVRSAQDLRWKFRAPQIHCSPLTAYSHIMGHMYELLPGVGDVSHSSKDFGQARGAA